MADDRVVTVTIKSEYDGKGEADAKKGLKDVEKQAEKTGNAAQEAGEKGNSGFSGMAAGVGKALAAFAAAKGILDFFASSSTAAAENTRAVNTLAAAYKAVGYTAEGAMKQAQQFATKMQNLTGIADEAFLNAQRLLANYGVVGTKAQKAIESAYALSIGKSMDFAAAMDLVSKAAVGQTQTLSRYGIQIDKNTAEGEKFDAVLAQINERFGETARAAMGDTISRTNALKEAWGDLKEEIGKGLNEGLSPAVAFLTNAVGVLNRVLKGIGVTFGVIYDNFFTGIQYLKGAFLAFAKSALDSFSPLVKVMSYIPGVGKNIKAAFDDASNSLGQMKYNAFEQARILADMRTPLKDILATEKEITEEQQAGLDLQANLINTRVANERIAQEQITEEARKGIEERNALEEDSANKRVDNEQKVSAFTKNASLMYQKTQTDNFKNTQTFFSQVGKLAASENKKLAEVGKAGSIAQATINTYEGATKALAQGGFYGIAMAAAVIAAGLAQVAQISNVKLAEGGLVKAVTGGVPAVIGEGGSDEAVLPLDDTKAMRRIGGAIAEEGGAMGGVVVNINVAASGGVEAILEQLTEASRSGVVQALEFANLNYKVGASQQGLSV